MGNTAIELKDSYSQVSNGIRVSVTPQHLDHQSDQARSIFAFAYTVLIENLDSEPCQLLERHWVIHSGGTRMAEVVGPGVVGELPVLRRGQSFEYTSSAVINDPVGAMEGEYLFQPIDIDREIDGPGKVFKVAIPRFDLIYPITYH